MFEVKSGIKNLRGKTITTWSGQPFHGNAFDVEVGTNGLQGGDSGHGGVTYFKLKSLGVDMNAHVVNEGTDCEQEIIIELGGDWELQGFIQSLEFAAQVLKDQIKE